MNQDQKGATNQITIDQVNGRSVHVALYARVSSELQAQEQTILSQVAALRERIVADDQRVDEELCFLDDGVSGTTLKRPALERLRDMAYAGGFQKLYVHSPDRLARKYAYQVLLVDELRQNGVEVVFLNRAIGVSPEEDLLLQMQGMFAEYERAKILERSRRGKRHGAKNGSVNVLSGAPYGYRYVTKRDGDGVASYEIVPEQAAIVRRIFEWIGRDRLSIGEVCRRLQQQGIPSPRGRKTWDRTSVWALLKNPAFCGRAAFGKTRVGERRTQVRPSRGQTKTPRRAGSTYDTPVSERVTISVPAIISEDLFAAVETQLAANQRQGRERRRGAKYLLQGLVSCSHCRYAYYGKPVSRSSAKGKVQYSYYRCIGTDAYRFGGQRVCFNKQIRTDLLDEAVWGDVQDLLRNPQLLRQEYERRLQVPAGDESRIRTMRQQEQSAQRSVNRLIDAFADGLLEKAEFEPRLAKARERVTKLSAELALFSTHAAEQSHLRAALACLDEFNSQMSQGLDKADWETRRELIRLLIERVSIEPEQVRIVYRISFPLFLQTLQLTSSEKPNERILHFCWSRDQSSARQYRAQSSGLGTRQGGVSFRTIRRRLCDRLHD